MFLVNSIQTTKKSIYLAILTLNSIIVTHTFFKKKNLFQGQLIASIIKKIMNYETMKKNI